MNEHLQELYNQVVKNDRLIFDSYLAEKFAQLIAKDVIHQAALIAVSNFQNEDVCWTIKTLITSLENRYDLK